MSLKLKYFKYLMALSLALGAMLPPTLLNASEIEFAKPNKLPIEDPQFLKVDEAFVLTADLLSDDRLNLRWQMPPGYYLYRHQFAVEAKDPDQVLLGELQIPPGKPKVDEYFGEVEVYYDRVELEVALDPRPGVNTQIGITYQGCADAGLCYPPEKKWFAYDGVRLLSALWTPPGEEAQSPVLADPSDPGPVVVTDTQEKLLASVLAGEGIWYALGLFFIAGIGLAFTPCVLPMVPILSSIIVGEGPNIAKSRAISLSATYVLGMAVTYAALGVLVGLFGAELNLQAALQSPPVLVFFALVFVLLSLSMFGFYELQLPQSVQDKLNTLGQKQEGGKYLSVLTMGALSSLVVSPCVSAPLAGALIYISTTNDAVLGGAALMSLGLGMGVPLMMVGGSGGHWLPRAGDWMNSVKAVFGVLLLAVAVWLLERVVSPATTLALWAALLLGSSVYLGVLDFAPKKGAAKFAQALGAIAFIWGALLLIGAASGAVDPLKPLARLQTPPGSQAAQPDVQEVRWVAVKSLSDVQREIASSAQPVMLDLYADWCISCKTMERNVFPDEAVAPQLARFTLLRADVTNNDEVDRQLLNHYGLFGPPSLVFFEADGRELEEVRVQGEVDAETLALHLAAVWRYFDQNLLMSER